jgi:hypothetical protein
VGQPHRERNGVAQEKAAALKTHNNSNNCHSILIIVVGSKTGKVMTWSLPFGHVSADTKQKSPVIHRYQEKVMTWTQFFFCISTD